MKPGTENDVTTWQPADLRAPIAGATLVTVGL